MSWSIVLHKIWVALDVPGSAALMAIFRLMVVTPVERDRI